MGAGREGLPVGVEDRAEDLVGVEDLARGAKLFMETMEGRELGVDDLAGFVVDGNVGLAVGVADLRVAVFGPSADKGLRLPVFELFNSEGKLGLLEAIFLLEAGSTWIFAGCIPRHGNKTLQTMEDKEQFEYYTLFS